MGLSIRAADRQTESQEVFSLGDMVLATARISERVEDGEIIYARPLDLGRVIGQEMGCLPTVRWIRSGLVCDVSTDSAILVKGEA